MYQKYHFQNYLNSMLSAIEKWAVTGKKEQILSQFYTKLQTILNKYTTASKVRPRESKLPWINSELFQLLKQKATLHKMYRLSWTTVSKNNFIQIRNNYPVELCKAISNSKLPIHLLPTQTHYDSAFFCFFFFFFFFFFIYCFSFYKAFYKVTQHEHRVFSVTVLQQNN